MTRQFTSIMILLAMFAAAVTPASAKSALLQEFKKKYPKFKFENIHSCMLCHQEAKKGVGPLNAYGKDFKAQKGTPAEKLAKIEKLDSDKDKFSNIVEINAGTNPGDPKSNPTTKAKATDAKTTGTLKMTQAADAKTTGTATAAKMQATDAKTTGTATAATAKPDAKTAKRKARKSKKAAAPQQ